MKVKALRRHINAYGPTPVKNVGRKYEVSDRDGANLIAAGLAVEDKPDPAPADEA